MRWYRHLLALWVIVGVVSSCFLFYWLDSSNSERRQETLSSMCDERARMLQDQLVASMNHVRALTALVTTFHLEKYPSALDQDTFATYASRTAFERPLMSGVAYAQKVLHEEREAFERNQGWSIKSMHSKKSQISQYEYAPATLTQDSVGYLTSLDLMSGQEDRENILRARASGKGALTSPFRLLTNHLGIVFTFAVYSEDLPLDATVEHRIQHCTGYLGGAFDVESLVENLLHQLAGSTAIVVNVYDITNQSVPLVMYGSAPDDERYHVSSLDFGDPIRRHEMRCRLVDPRPMSWAALWAALGLLVICLLVGQIGYAAVRRITQVEEDYKKMEELKLQAESADVAKSQFLATVSHEIRTPMNGVLGMLQMLMDTKLDPMQIDYARTAQASGQALITLINEVLDQAKIESGRLELESVCFDLREVLDDVLSLFSSKASEKRIELAVYVSKRVPEILVGDPSRFRQIITNLIGNSVKFTQYGHVFLCVHLAEDMEELQELIEKDRYSALQDLEEDSQGSWNTLSGVRAADRRYCWEFFRVLLQKTDAESNSALQRSEENVQSQCDLADKVKLLISVEDTGVGIPFHAQRRIFTPFMQADSSTSRMYGGTGIGLSISRCLVELMSGKMCFVSLPNIGTTFSFTVALRKPPHAMCQDVKSVVHVSKFVGLKALVLDGRDVRAYVAQQQLHRIGVEAHVVTDMQSANALLAGEHDMGSTIPSCSTGDLDMVFVDKDSFGPGSGLTLALHFYILNSSAKLAGNPPVFIILATCYTDEEAEQVKKAGLVIIRKPLRASMLATSLEQALGMLGRGDDRREPSEAFIALRNLFNGRHLLVVDDNVVNRRVAAGALKKYGAKVDCVESGKAAIKLLRPPHKFDACFMDVQMPEMDGFEATRLIRKEEWAAVVSPSPGKSGDQDGDIHKWHTPIWAMTADVIQATHEECLRAGMDGFVAKPFDENKLHQAVLGFLTCSSNCTKFMNRQWHIADRALDAK